MGSMTHPLVVHDGSLWVGEVPSDAAGRGLELREGAVVLHGGDCPAQLIQWSEVHHVDLTIEQSRWSRPSVMSWLLGLVAGLFDLWSPGLPDDIDVSVVTERGQQDHTFFAHNRGGYPRPRVAVLHALLRVLVEQPATRGALAHPVDVVHSFDAIVADVHEDLADQLALDLLDIVERGTGTPPRR